MSSSNIPLSRRQVLIGAAATSSALALSGCATNKATGRNSFTGFSSVQDDIKIGEREHPKLIQAFGGEYENRKLQSYITNVGRSLAQHAEYQQFKYNFTLLNSPIVNAFALPGGYVYLTRGLLALASNEAEMAGVLGHELGHVNARHTAERMSTGKMAQMGIIGGSILAQIFGAPGLGQAIQQIAEPIAMAAIQSFSRDQEFEADMLGVRYMSKARYEPDAMVTFLSTLREQSQVDAKSRGLDPGIIDEFNMMSTHPRTIDRVREAQNQANVQRHKQAITGQSQYYSNINGMLFGDDPEQGLVYGNRFVHPDLRFEYTVPDGFRIQNAPDSVVAQNKDGAAIIFSIAPAKYANNPAEYLKREFKEAPNLKDIRSLKINNLRSASGITRGKMSNGAVYDVRPVVYSRDAQSVWRLMFFSPVNQSSRLDDAFKKTAFSFREISASEASKIKPLRVRVKSARSSDRVSRLSRSLPYGQYNAEWFRVLNDIQAGREPKSGSKLKVITT